MWTSFFDKIYVINLAKRTDRMQQATEQLKKYGIPFERFEAIEHPNGAEGLRLTMVGIFNEAIRENWQHLLIFEDDVDVIEPTFNEVMEEITKDVPPNFDMILLGGQLCKIPEAWYGNHLLRAKSMFATHAVMYSLKGIKKAIGMGISSPVDNFFVSYVQEAGDSYMTFPLLCSQIISHSDIYTAEEFQNWKPHIEGKYWNRIEAMQQNGIVNPNAKVYQHG